VEEPFGSLDEQFRWDYFQWRFIERWSVQWHSSSVNSVDREGPRPLPPVNLSVHQLRNGSLNISWQAPVHSPSPILFYQILYRTVGQWVPLNDRLTANVTWYLWTTASRGAIYSFKVTSYGQLAKSDASSVVLFNTGGKIM